MRTKVLAVYTIYVLLLELLLWVLVGPQFALFAALSSTAGLVLLAAVMSNSSPGN